MKQQELSMKEKAEKIALSYTQEQYETIARRFIISQVERIQLGCSKLENLDPFKDEAWQILKQCAQIWWSLGKDFQHIARKLFPDERIFNTLDRYLNIELALINICKLGALPLTDDLLGI